MTTTTAPEKKTQTVTLWPGAAPGALGTGPRDSPRLTFYEPCHLTAPMAVMVCPGGAYQDHAIDHEGIQIARFFNDLGALAAVLEYRLGPKYHHPCMLQDVARGMRLMRARAAELGADPSCVGVMGFSAGGHLASTLATHWDTGQPEAADPIERQSSRPDFAILCYPVVTMTQNTHGGSRLNLLGENPCPELVELLSNEKQVTAQTPPTFLFHTVDDPGVPVENSLEFARALRAAGVDFELHCYQHGEHGVGLARGDHYKPYLESWPDRLVDWLRLRGLLPG